MIKKCTICGQNFETNIKTKTVCSLICRKEKLKISSRISIRKKRSMIKKEKNTQCKSCGHQWNPRNDQVKRCPKCSSRKWNRLNKSKYGLSDIGIKQQKIIKWYINKNGMPDLKKNSDVTYAVRAYGRRTGKKFFIEYKTIGIIIHRLH